jgi:uncharacterized membrane protein YgcG
VADLANILTDPQKAQLASQAAEIEKTTSSEVVFLTVVLDDPSQLNAYATELGHQWGIGKADVDNGVVIAVAANRKEAFLAPKPGDKRRAEVVTGYGVGGAIPDITAKSIVDNQMKPSLAKGDYAGAFAAAGSQVASLIAADSSTKSKGQTAPTQGDGLGLLLFLLAGVFIVGVAAMMFARRARRYEAQDVYVPRPRATTTPRPSVPVGRRSYVPPVPVILPDHREPTERPKPAKKRDDSSSRRHDDDSYRSPRIDPSPPSSSGWDTGSSIGSSGGSDFGSFGSGDFGGGGGGSDF